MVVQRRWYAAEELRLPVRHVMLKPPRAHLHYSFYFHGFTVDFEVS